MSIIIVLILLLLAVTSLIFNYRRNGIFTALLAFILFFLAGSGILTQPILNSLQSHAPLTAPHWAKRNAILILGIGTTPWPDNSRISTHPLGYSRIHEAARLYYLCKKQTAVCRVITTGGDPTKHGTAEATVMARELIEIGVPSADIIIEPRSRNTYENAKFSGEIIHSQKLDKIILVTSGFHMTRSLLFFQSFNLHPTPAPSDRLSSHFSLVPLSQNFALLDLALHEHTGMSQYYLYNFMGWNSITNKDRNS